MSEGVKGGNNEPVVVIKLRVSKVRKPRQLETVIVKDRIDSGDVSSPHIFNLFLNVFLCRVGNWGDDGINENNEIIRIQDKIDKSLGGHDNRKVGGNRCGDSKTQKFLRDDRLRLKTNSEASLPAPSVKEITG